MDNAEGTKLFAVTELRRFTADVLRAVMVPADEASIIATVLTDADLRGFDSNGFHLLPYYVPHLKQGTINPRPKITLVRESPATALLDGDGGMGHLVGARAMELALPKASEAGACIVGIRNSRHWGAAAYHVARALEHDMIGLAFVVAGGNTIAPWGGLDPLVGNNPIAVAVPAGREPSVLLDMGTSVASRGKILLAEKFSQPIPDGWATDKDGRPTSDARAALDGLLLPFGGYKGYGLSVMIALLGGALTGAAFGSDLNGPFDLPCNNGYLLAAIDIKRFMPMEEFRQRVDHYMRELKQARRAGGVDRIYVPGEIEHETMQRRQREGVPLGSEIQEDAQRLARELGVRPLAHGDS